jgi:hypothetical protein
MTMSMTQKVGIVTFYQPLKQLKGEIGERRRPSACPEEFEGLRSGRVVF